MSKSTLVECRKLTHKLVKCLSKEFNLDGGGNPDLSYRSMCIEAMINQIGDIEYAIEDLKMYDKLIKRPK